MFHRRPWYTTDSGMYKGLSAHHPTIIGSFYHYFRGLSSPGFFIFIAPQSGETAGLPICTVGALHEAPAPRWRIGEKAPSAAQGCPVLRRGRRPRRPITGRQSLNGCVGCGWKRFLRRAALPQGHWLHKPLVPRGVSLALCVPPCTVRDCQTVSLVADGHNAFVGRDDPARRLHGCRYPCTV